MCRFTLYLGPPVRLRTLLIEPSHSLIQQSAHALERQEPLNGDGFGVGWYVPTVSDEPAVFRAITPAWNNRNLESLAGVVTSPCVLAHVRAATDGMSVSEANCHPFQHGPWLFMHNGAVGAFQGIRRRLLEGLSDDAFALVQGTTDSEVLFAMFIDEIWADDGSDPGLCMAECLNRVAFRVQELVGEHGGGAPSSLNVAVSDGHRAVACRFTDDPDRPAESLYYTLRGLYRPADEGSPLRRETERSASVVVASERLTHDPAWVAVPVNHLLAVDRDGRARLYRMGEAGLLPA